MFKVTDKLIDNHQDEILSLLKILAKRKSWNSESNEILTKIKDLLKKNNYKEFSGRPNRYHLSRLGDSCLYDVPMYKKGFLKEFRGERIRIVCIASKRFNRTYLTKSIGETPPDKLIKKRTFKYIFPDIGDHDIEYFGRRYMLINSKGKKPISMYQGSFEEIDLKTCDYILLDGKSCCPIAKLIKNKNGSVTGRFTNLEHWYEDFPSILDAIKGIIKLRYMWEQ